MENRKMTRTQLVWKPEWIDHARLILAAGGSFGNAAIGVSNKFKVTVSRNAMIGKFGRLKEAGELNLPEPEIWRGKSMVTLVSYWNRGVSAAEIANIFEVETPTLRNKAYMYGMHPRGSEAGLRVIKSNPKYLQNKSPAFVTKMKEFLNPKALGLDIMDLDRKMCRFVIGDKPFYFCAAPVEVGSPVPYCSYCRKVMYVPVKR